MTSKASNGEILALEIVALTLDSFVDAMHVVVDVGVKLAPVAFGGRLPI
jgi:hypothetical protein